MQQLLVQSSKNRSTIPATSTSRGGAANQCIAIDKGSHRSRAREFVPPLPTAAANLEHVGLGRCKPVSGGTRFSLKLIWTSECASQHSSCGEEGARPRTLVITGKVILLSKAFNSGARDDDPGRIELVNVHDILWHQTIRLCHRRLPAWLIL